jgi:hypothetical protein
MIRRDGPPRMVARSTWSGRERSSHSRFLPVPRVGLVTFALLLRFLFYVVLPFSLLHFLLAVHRYPCIYRFLALSLVFIFFCPRVFVERSAVLSERLSSKFFALRDAHSVRLPREFPRLADTGGQALGNALAS